MVTENSTQNKFKVSFQGDAGSGGHWIGYTSSKSMLRVERLDVQKLSIVEIFGSPLPNKITNYYTDPNGVLEIPIRNMLAQNQNFTPPTMGLDIGMREIDGGAVDVFGKYIDVVPGVAYNDALAPRNKDAAQLYWAGEHNVVLPPNVIINPDTFAGVAGFGIIVESNYHILDADAVWSEIIGGLSNTITPTGRRICELEIRYAAKTLSLVAGKNHDQLKDWPLLKPDGCSDLVVCRWTSKTGAVRQHYFPIVSFIKGSDKQVSIMSAGDGYLVDKNIYDGIRCRLTGLTSYGYWYYADIVQASDLHAIVQPTFASFEDEIASAQTAAYVEAGDMETPQGNGFYNLEFTIKLRHYGTL
jgi:hypothetical protein